MTAPFEGDSMQPQEHWHVEWQMENGRQDRMNELLRSAAADNV